MVKPLPTNLSTELFMKLNYASCRFMKSKRAYRTGYNDNVKYFTAKLEQGDDERGNIKMLHIHLRTPAKDRWFGDEEDLDIDLYIHEDSLEELKELLLKSELKPEQLTIETKQEVRKV